MIYRNSILKLTGIVLTAMAALSMTHAQTRVSVEALQIQPQAGGNVRVELRFNLSRLHIKAAESLIYTPILVTPSERIELPKLILKSKLRYRIDKREQALNGTPLEAVSNREVNLKNPVFAVLQVDSKLKKTGFVSYAATAICRSRSDDASLELREEAFGCCGTPAQPVNTDKASSDKPIHINPRFRYLTPEREKEKLRYEIGEAFLDFPQGQSRILRDFHSNRYELDKVNAMLLMISNDPDVRVTHVEMRGYASPEGSQQLNYDLSFRRAQALREYFARQSSAIPPSLFHTGIGGEDWESLRLMIQDPHYALAYKRDVLRVIEREYDLDRRELLLKQIAAGRPYRQFYRDLYPKLRRVECQINYVVRDFTLEEGKQRIREKPKLLSQNEMYQIARTYPEGSPEFNETLKTARSHFPDNDVANLNGAAAALMDGDTALARANLDRVQDKQSAEYNNCLGVLLIYEGKFADAEACLQRALNAGLSEAAHNLDELNRTKNKR